MNNLQWKPDKTRTQGTCFDLWVDGRLRAWVLQMRDGHWRCGPLTRFGAVPFDTAEQAQEAIIMYAVTARMDGIPLWE